MTGEIAAYSESILDRLDQIASVVRGLDADTLNRRPLIDNGNSVWVLATHAAGNARAWILGIACGREMGRDRPAEFASSGDDIGELIAQLAQTAADVASALAALDPARLEERLVPAQELWGEGPPREISVRDAVIQVIEHASLHLGHMHVTRDLARAAR